MRGSFGHLETQILSFFRKADGFLLFSEEAGYAVLRVLLGMSSFSVLCIGKERAANMKPEVSNRTGQIKLT